MKVKGFTLIELLAVIVILAIIALIAVPIVLNIIGSSKKSAVTRSAELYLKTVETAIARENLKTQFNPISCTIKSDGNLICIDENNIEIELVIESTGSKPTSGIIKIVKGKIVSVKGFKLDGYEIEKEEGKKLSIKGEAKDTTPAEVKVNINKRTTNSITIIVEATDLESGIKEYKYSTDGTNYTVGNNTYTLSNLTSGEKYTIYVKVINGIDLETYKEIEITTLTINEPTYEIDNSDVASSKIVTINYPTIEGQELTYEYSLDKGATWLSATQVQTVTFTSNGTIIARVKDGINTVTETTFTVNNVIDYLMVNPQVTSIDTTFLGGSINRSTVESITIMNNKEIPSSAIGSWDVSEKQNGSIMAWYTDIDNNNKYELYIGGEGKVYANPNSSHLFNYFDLKSIDLTYLDTSQVTNMYAMFGFCSYPSLDLSSFDTSQVTNMSFMFAQSGDANKSINLDLSSFDTSSVIDMSNMFTLCRVSSIDIRNFDTSKVINMTQMFYWTVALKEINMRNVTFNSVIDYSKMLGQAIELKNVIVKDTTAKEFIEARLAEDNISWTTVTIAE